MKDIIRGFIKLTGYCFLLLTVSFAFSGISLAQENKNDTVQSYLKYPLPDSRLPFQNSNQPSGMQLKLPPNVVPSVEYDPKTNEYDFQEKVGSYDYVPPYSMSLPEYRKYEMDNSMKQYWRERAKSDQNTSSGNSFVPRLNIDALDKLFGNNAISIVPQGSAELIFGVNTSRVDNPQLPEKLRRTTTFDFQEKIAMNVTGNIGDKMHLKVNYNTEATFDFENKTNLEYTGKEDEIIRKIEAGNVSLPLTGSLITGSQSLFGIKTELQFGKLNVTTVFSQQKGESQVIDVKGGAQVSDFEITADNYEANKHFFLADYFRNHYEEALKNLPFINSKVVITKIEVWVTNKNNSFTDARSVVAFADLGEAEPFNKVPNFTTLYPTGDNVPDNSISSLYEHVSNSTDQYSARDVKTVSNNLNPLKGLYNFSQGQDYEKMESARRLTDKEFTFHPTLGYISLNFSLNNDEILAVAYEFTYNGKTYHVGELSTSGVAAPQALVLKLLKGTTLTPQMPTWNLMMKNIYSINAYQVNKDNFKLDVLYQDDKNGTALNYIPEDLTSKDILLRVENLDRLNTQNDPHPDGVFDFVDGVTINSSNGRIIFPVLEPFGKTIHDYLQKKYPGNSQLVDKYTYSELYNQTQTSARQFPEKNKYKLRGTYQSASSSEIALNALNVPQGSVVVTAGGRKLTENVDYTVDYTLGRVKIINTGLLESGTPLKISLESNSLFNFQTKTLVGTHLDYKFSDNFNLGATILNLTERPLTEKVNIGDEPISNTIWGLNGTYTTKSQLITTLVDKIPFIQTKEPSSLTVDGEFAHLIPGHSKAIKKGGTSYIDDFESSETSIDMKTFSAWSLASTPEDPQQFPEASRMNDLSYGANRAKLAWYVIDPLFLRNNSATPANIKRNPNSQSSHFVREVYEDEIFKNYQNPSGLPTNIPVLNLAFYPKERGPYNYDTLNVAKNGSLLDPKDRWGGIQREIVSSDFETSNIEFIEFWLMDPFVEDTFHTNKGGQLYFNLGDVSEDVLKDSRKSFENGFPTSSSVTNVDTTVWGRVPSSQSIGYAFDNNDQSRKYQDIGIDGLDDADERSFFGKFIRSLGRQGIDTTKISRDPSSDDFHYFRGDIYDQEDLGILARYKNYNGLEGNSPALGGSNSDYTPSNSSLPDVEDINQDNTLDENERFYQYKVDITPEQMKIGRNFIIDSVVSNPITFPNGKKSSVSWYQFRIPITDFQKAIGGISDFKSIRFMRMYLRGFDDSIILRFAKLELVRGEWRKYNLNFKQGGESLSTPEEDDASFEISSVNIEENSDKTPVNYVLPEGVDRQIDPSNPQLRELNEQSMVLRVHDLPNGDARAAYKNVNLDIRQYRHLKMDVHAEEIPGTTLADDEVTVFIRLGSDYKNNFYEYEVPLKLTPPGRYDNGSNDDRLIVWPADNRIDILLENLQRVKQARNDEMRQMGSTVSLTTVFPYKFDNDLGTYYVAGNPNLSNVKTIMIGVRYPRSADKIGQIRSAEVWVNELRVTDFNEKGGWAANLRLTSKLADFGSVSVAGSMSTPGFGSIEKKVNERSKEEVKQYDVATNLDLGKFFPEKAGVQVPMYAGISESVITPQYNPLDPDIELKAALKNAKSASERDSIKKISQDYTQRKSLNFTNVKINKTKGKPHFYDISNWTANYSFNQTYSRNINTVLNIEKRFAGGLMYAYQLKPKPVTPFQKMKLFSAKPLRLIRDFNFNYLPTSFSFRTDMARDYNEVQLRNINNPGEVISPTVDKNFFWNRYYDLSWDLTRSMRLDYTASNTARVDDAWGENGIVDKRFKDEYQNWKDSVWHSILKGGTTSHYQQDLHLTYTIPINKLPMLDWTSANVQYAATYDWDVAAKGLDSLGNSIKNSANLTTSAQLNLVNLYNKVPYFRKLSQPERPNQGNQQKKMKKVTYERDKTFLKANEPKVINHSLKTEDVAVKVYDSDGKEIKGKVDVVNENRVMFTTAKDYTGVKIVVEGNVEQKPNPLIFVAKTASRFLISVKNFSVSWSRMQGTAVNGFMPGTKLFGMDNSQQEYAPGLGFVVGLQDKNFAKKAGEKGWLSTSQSLNQPYLMTLIDNVNVRSSIEPIPGFRIELNGRRVYTSTESSYYIFNNGVFNPSNYTQSGNFSISFLAIGSAFEKLDPNKQYESPVFEKFRENRIIISQRLGRTRAGIDPSGYGQNVNFYPNTNIPITDGSTNGYSLTSQEVVIPAFMAAYGNINPNRVTLDRFPSVFHIMPNWTIRYDGLSKLKILKKYIRSIGLNHAYMANYTIGNYITNPQFYDTFDVEKMLSNATDLLNNFIPQWDISSVALTEQFSPLRGVDVTFVNSLSTRVELKRSRNVVLSLANNQVTDNSSKEVVVGVGYKFKDVQFKIKSASGEKQYKSDLNVRGDFSIRDNKMIFRPLDDVATPSSGQNVVTLKISADYQLSSNFNLRMFYDRIVNNPFTSNSGFRTSNANMGFSVRFSLTQ